MYNSYFKMKWFRHKGFKDIISFFCKVTTFNLFTQISLFMFLLRFFTSNFKFCLLCKMLIIKFKNGFKRLYSFYKRIQMINNRNKFGKEINFAMSKQTNDTSSQINF